MSRSRNFLNWAVDTFGPIAADKGERASRFAEEAIEVAHAAGVDAATLCKIVERVFSRPAGELKREIGQAQMCLETLAEIVGTNVDWEAITEFDRVQAIPKEEWKRRHDAKVALGIASN